MSPETLSRAVEPFYSTKELGRGTGLGLTMVHGLAAQLGGGFAISSELGQGTRVDVYLPVAGRDAFTTAVPEPGAAGTVERTLRLLLVDDEELVRFATAELVRELGNQVTEVASGGRSAGADRRRAAGRCSDHRLQDAAHGRRRAGSSHP